MLGGNNVNCLLPVLLDETQFRHQTNASNQLQLFRNLQAGCNVDPVNYFGNEHISSMILPNKQSKEVEDISKRGFKFP
ncbi:E3 ubiquitin-protein ligase BOI isoform X1 [Spatholobus suberectus]|nr:E3 ubiquitin-protein ligase BOI isoform X1 [Spatholobus suberectus]